MFVKERQSWSKRDLQVRAADTVALLQTVFNLRAQIKAKILVEPTVRYGPI
jgi:hypothetical protein